MERKSEFLTNLELRDLEPWELTDPQIAAMEISRADVEDRFSEVVEDLVYYSEILGAEIRVPKCFITDKASVPRVPIVYWFFGDRAHRESVLHDYLFQTQLVSFSMANAIFKEAMNARGKSGWVRYGMWAGVALGGYSSYKSGPKRFMVLNKARPA